MTALSEGRASERFPAHAALDGETRELALHRRGRLPEGERRVYRSVSGPDAEVTVTMRSTGAAFESEGFEGTLQVTAPGTGESRFRFRGDCGV